MKTLTTRYGKKLPFDAQRWSLKTSNYTCQIVGEREDDYLLLDTNALVTWVPKATIRDNAYEIVGDEVTLSAGVYAKWITSPPLAQSHRRFYELFSPHRELLFANRQLVLSRAEYFLMYPDLLKSGGAYIGGFRYSLGALLEAMEEKAPGVYFEEFAGYRELYLVSLSGSPLSGIHHSLFWSEEQQQLIQINSSQSRLPGGFMAAFRTFKEAVNQGSGGLSFPGEALEQLLGELGVEV
ncbi:MAG: hypothetical protein LW824_07410 [Algoriphagus sp.]|nr:hypothetical protein [Algoriphagus sp.]